MRIESYNQVQQLYQSQLQANKAQKAAQVYKKDQVQISSMGRDIQTAKAAAKAAPDVREDLVADIKARVDSGTYSVSNESFAEKLLAKYNEMR